MEVHDHIALADFLRLKNLLWIHTPNEGKRSYPTAKLLKRMGMQSGVPDFLIFDRPLDSNYVGCAIELKYGKNKPTKNQKTWMEELQKRGWYTKICYSFEEAKNVIEELYG